MTRSPYRTVGTYLASMLEGTWHPYTEADDPRDLSGHLEVNGLWLWLGMELYPDGFPDNGAQWLQIGTMAVVDRIDGEQDPQSCGKGLGTKAIKSLQQWTQEHKTTMRVVGIENAAFFSRFAWVESDFDDPHDGQCWYY